MTGHSFVDGVIVKTEEARIPIDDVGFLRGYAIYEGITTVGTKPAFLEDHLDRLERSAELLHIALPYSRSEIEDICNLLSERVTSPRGDLRLVLSGGSSPDGLAPGEKGYLYGIVNNLTPLPSALYTDGAKVMIHEYMRFMPECKTNHYTTAAMLQKARKEGGFSEILYTYKGNVLEASTSNFFMVKNGVVITPKSNVLYGVTRKKTLELIKSSQMKLEEREVSVKEMFEADEVFLTSSYKDVLPIVIVGDSVIGDGKVGEVTKRLLGLYEGLLESV